MAATLRIVVACYQPPQPDCGFFCGSGGECPSDYTCGADQRCHLDGSPIGACASAFTVATAQSTFVTTVVITFSDAPDPVSASDAANYAIANLSLADVVPEVTGNTVVLTTAPQLSQLYSLTVANVTRLADGQPLTPAQMSFVGRSAFDLVSATAPSANEVDLVFDAAPAATQVFCLENYNLGGFGVTDAILDGSTVELSTTTQDGSFVTVVVGNIVRASDGEQLSTSTAMLLSDTPFGVVAAFATDTQDVTVQFTDQPDTTSATQVANYVIVDGSGSQLPVLQPPVVSGDSVTLHTAAQTAALDYTVTVSGVVRASDGEMLETGETSALFAGQ
jgi:hypothetical protein